MILVFPNVETLRLVAAGGLLPPEVVMHEAAVGHDADGRLHVDTGVKFSKKAAADLVKLNVRAVKVAADVTFRRVSCWLEVLPVEKLKTPPVLASQTPVLLELPTAHDLPAVVTEMLRLGNDRQSFRWLASDTADDRRVLLRVIGPPYYTLLRALDGLESGPAGPVRAYTEAAPRVWVQLGYAHESAAHLQLPEDRLLLVRPPHDWLALTDEPFQDIYDILHFKLPASPVDWLPAATDDKLDVPLSLAPGNATDVPEMWVLRGDGLSQLDAFVRDADERIVQRLRFAVATSASGETVLVLRVSPSKLLPPTVHLESAVGYKNYHKLPNLFLPVGTRLHPPLRRDAVRTLLADDDARVVWLAPGADGQFTPESLTDDAFRPLADWVEYVIDTAREPLTAWVQASGFEFESFVCGDDRPAKPKDGGRDKARRPRDPDPIPLTPAPDAPAARGATTFASQALPKKTPTEWLARRGELEQKFLGIPGQLDHPDRIALWAELAVANAHTGDLSEAAVCWANALWHADDPTLAWGWADTELSAVGRRLSADEIDRRLTTADPSRVEVRQLAAAAIALVADMPDWLTPRLAHLQKFFEANETKLSVRTAWLIATKLARATGADVLGLARTRDRLLQRLLESGLNPEIDLPVFLRTAGMKDSDRLRTVRERVGELYRHVRGWVEREPPKSLTAQPHQSTLPYVDLYFAFAFARLGESVAADELVERARLPMAAREPDPRCVSKTSDLLYRCFRQRIDQALNGKAIAGPFDAAVLADFDAAFAGIKTGVNNPLSVAKYAVTRFWTESRLLLPDESLDPYAEGMKFTNPFDIALQHLRTLRNPTDLAAKFRTLFRDDAAEKDDRPLPVRRFLLLLTAVPLAGRVGELFAIELLRLVPDALAAVSTAAVPEFAKKASDLLEASLFLATHYDQRELVQRLIEVFHQVIGEASDETRTEVISRVAGPCQRILRKVRLLDELDDLLRRLQGIVLGDETPAEMRKRLTTKPDQWGRKLLSLLHLAAGWIALAQPERAEPILELARRDLLEPPLVRLRALEFTRLVQQYVHALALLPAEIGLDRLAELFDHLDPAAVTNALTTAPFYSRLHLTVIEELVLSLVDDGFDLSPVGRRWLSDDEFLIRRRIHADLKRALAGGGW